MKMGCVRNFLLSMPCLLAFGQYTYGLSVSLRNLNLGVSRSDLYTRQSSSANASVQSQNLTLPPNPFVFESAAGYFAVYTVTGSSSFGHPIASRLMVLAMAELRQQRQAEQEDITGPIPGNRFQASESQPGFILTWAIGQQGVRTTETLSYQHAEIALQGTQEVVRQYDILVREYEFSLFKTRSMQLVAKGQLKGLQDISTS